MDFSLNPAPNYNNQTDYKRKRKQNVCLVFAHDIAQPYTLLAIAAGS